MASRILLDFGADAEKIRSELIQMLSGPDRPGAGGDVLPPETLPHTRARPASRHRVRQSVRPATIRIDRTPLLAAIGLAAAAFPLGLLVGWLIWG